MHNIPHIWGEITSPARGKYLLWGLLLAFSYTPVAVHALGVLEPQLKSYINEPLAIEIPILLSEREKDIDVDIVIQQIENKSQNIREWIPDLKFSLISDAEDNFTIIAKTNKPVNEPIVQFTVSIDTGFNWIQREMSFLLDPKPILALAAERAKRIKPKAVLKPSEAQMRHAATAAVETSPPVYTEDSTTYFVQSGDSLSLIAQKFRQSRGVTAHQAMVAVFNANPEAFIGGDVNKIKSHYKIIIPDETQMKHLSSTEARSIFNQLMVDDMTPVQRKPASVVPQHGMPAIVQTDDKAVDQIQPASENITDEEPPALPAAEPDAEYHLTLTPENEEIPENIIRENTGTVVYETIETDAFKAASPSPEVKKAMRNAVNEMEEQLVALRQEVKQLRQSLQSKDNLLALKAETRIQSLQPAQPVTEPVNVTPSIAAVDTPVQEQGPIELVTSETDSTESEFDLLLLFMEILTIAAATGFIVYFIIIRRKQDDDEVLEPSGVFKPAEVTDVGSVIQPPSNITINREKQQGIEVTEEEYDGSIDFSHPEAEPETVSGPPEEEFNAAYILQEANLSIAFSDLDNAYHLLIKLINYDPRNAEYRLLMLGVLRDLLKEEEFIYHANHLASITNKSSDTEWQRAFEIGHEYLPNHPLFSPSEPVSRPEKPPTSNRQLSDPPKTVVLETRKALAEYERRLKEKETLAKQPASTEPELDLILEGFDDDSTDTEKEDKPFRLNLTEASEPEDFESRLSTENKPAQPASTENLPLDLSEILDADNLETQADDSGNEPSLGQYSIDNPLTNENVPVTTQSDTTHVLEFDETQAKGNQLQDPVTAGDDSPAGNSIEFDHISGAAGSVVSTTGEIAKELEGDLNPQALADYCAVEGIEVDRELLHFDDPLGEENKDTEDNDEKTLLLKRD